MEQNISTIKQRILHFAKTKGLSKRKIYIQTGIANGVFDKPTGLTEDSIEKFCSTYEEVSVEWLMTGRGEMFKKNHENLSYNNTNELIMIRELSEELALVKKELSDLKNAQTKKPHTTTYNVAAEAELSKRYTKKHAQKH